MIEQAKINFKIEQEPSQKRILILDGDPFSVDVVVSILNGIQLPDIQVDTCFDSEAAMKLVKNSIKDEESDYCLILSDLSMPLVDGFEFVKRVRRYFEMNEVPRNA